MLVSLRVGLIAIVVLVAVIAATVAFVPLQQAADDIVTNNAREFALTVSAAIVSSVSRYFHNNQVVASTMVGAASVGAWDERDQQSLLVWLNYGVTLGADSINVIFDSPNIWTAGFVTTKGIQLPPGEVAITKYNATHELAGVYVVKNLTLLSMDITPRTVLFRTRAYYPIIRARQAWGPPFVGVLLGQNETILPCGAPVVSPNGTSYGAFYVRTRTRVVVEYFRQLRIATSGRAMLLDESTRSVIATSNPSDPTIVYRGGVAGLATLNDVVDPLLSRVVALLGADALFTASPLPHTVAVGQRSSLVFVTISSVNDSFNLSKRLVVAIPSEDFLGGIRRAMTTSLIATACAVVALVLSAFSLMWIASQPLAELAENLTAAGALGASKHLLDPISSSIKEVVAIQDAYLKLCADLALVRSFIQSSVLQKPSRALSGSDAADRAGDNTEQEEDDIVHLSPDSLRDQTGPVTSPLSPVVLPNNIVVERSGGNPLASSAPNKAAAAARDSLYPRVPRLNIGATLATRRVTILFVNLNSSHAFLQHRGALPLQRRMATLVDLVTDVLDKWRGVIDFFHGDHFMLSFNGSASCSAQGSKCASVVVELTAGLRGATDGIAPTLEEQGLRMGVSTGTALVGNFGSSRIRRFCVIGHVVNQAFALMLHARNERVTSLISPTAYDVMKDDFVLEHRSLVSLTVGSGVTQPSLISTILYKRRHQLFHSGTSAVSDGGVQEHVDEVEQTYDLLNSAFELLVNQDLAGALAISATIPPQYKANFLRLVSTMYPAESSGEPPLYQ